MKRKWIIVSSLSIVFLMFITLGALYAQQNSSDEEPLKRIEIQMNHSGRMDIQFKLYKGKEECYSTKTYVNGDIWSQDHITFHANPYGGSSIPSGIYTAVLEMEWGGEKGRWWLKLTPQLLEKFRTLGKYKEGVLELNCDDRFNGVLIERESHNKE